MHTTEFIDAWNNNLDPKPSLLWLALYRGPRPHYPEEFENRAFFHRLVLPFTLILKTEEFENGALRFSVDGIHFENGAF